MGLSINEIRSSTLLGPEPVWGPWAGREPFTARRGRPNYRDDLPADPWKPLLVTVPAILALLLLVCDFPRL